MIMDDNAKIILHKDYTEQNPEGSGAQNIVKKVKFAEQFMIGISFRIRCGLIDFETGKITSKGYIVTDVLNFKEFVLCYRSPIYPGIFTH